MASSRASLEDEFEAQDRAAKRLDEVYAKVEEELADLGEMMMGRS
jgi:hypothetical protein